MAVVKIGSERIEGMPILGTTTGGLGNFAVGGRLFGSFSWGLDAAVFPHEFPHGFRFPGSFD